MLDRKFHHRKNNGVHQANERENTGKWATDQAILVPWCVLRWLLPMCIFFINLASPMVQQEWNWNTGMQSLKTWRLICSESASEYDYFAAQEVMKVNLSQSSGCSIVYFGFPAERLRNRKNEDTVAATLCPAMLHTSVALLRAARTQELFLETVLGFDREIPSGIVCPNSPMVFALAKFTTGTSLI